MPGPVSLAIRDELSELAGYRRCSIKEIRWEWNNRGRRERQREAPFHRGGGGYT